MLEVKRIYNCLLDFVPSVSCKNTASNKFLLLTAKKKKNFEPPIVRPKQGNTGTETRNQFIPRCRVRPQAYP